MTNLYSKEKKSAYENIEYERTSIKDIGNCRYCI